MNHNLKLQRLRYNVVFQKVDGVIFDLKIRVFCVPFKRNHHNCTKI